jgi:phosphoglycerate dehydrogenase-like enzyme
MTSSAQIRIVLPGGSARGEPWLRERLPDAALVPVADGDHAALRAALADADAIVCAELSADDTADASRLKLVHVLGAGYDGIAEDALPPGCTLCNVFEHETAISEWILMTMLALSRRLLVYDRDLRRGMWHEAVSFSGVPERDLRGETAGLIGLGHIGTRTAQILHAIGMRTIAVTRRPSPERQEAAQLDWLGDMSELERLLRESRFAVLCLPLAADTRELIGADELAALGDDGFLVNVGRGPLVNEGALYDALRDGVIAGAALDVWYRYPSRVGETVMPAEKPFWELDNVVMTPHESGWSASTLDGRWRFMAQQMERLAAGLPLENVVRVAG